MLIKHAILVALVVPYIMATLSKRVIAEALIKAENEEDLVQTFKKLEKEQRGYQLFGALVKVSNVPEHMPKVAICLRTAVDPFPTGISQVSWSLNNIIGLISDDTFYDPESFAKVVASFKPSDVKLLASIRLWTLRRKDALKVLESVLAKSPELITGDLPRWLADHSFGQNSFAYTRDKVARKQTFQYLTSFATESILTNALSLVKANDHFKVGSGVGCCESQSSFPQDLVNKLESLLVLVKDRNARINEALTLLPKVLAEMVADYLPTSTD